MNDYDPNYIATKTYMLVGQKAIIFNKDGQFLILQRSEKAGDAGKWSFAGGALEEKEKPVEGILREIKEETQLDVEKLKPFTVFSYTNKDDDSVVMICYTCIAKNPDVIINWEHDDYKWVTKDEALKMDMGEHARRLIEKLDE